MVLLFFQCSIVIILCFVYMVNNLIDGIFRLATVEIVFTFDDIVEFLVIVNFLGCLGLLLLTDLVSFDCLEFKHALFLV